MTSTGRRSIIQLRPGMGQVCPICQNDAGCGIFSDGRAVICLRVEEGCARRRDGTAFQAKEGMGWLHFLDGHKGRGMKLPKGKLPPPKLSPTEIRIALKHCKADLTTPRLDALAKELGIGAAHLKAYGVGWDTQSGCYSFPMVGSDLKPIGIRLRSLDGKKKCCVSGSSNGLFVPSDYAVEAVPDFLSDDPSPLLLLLPEGPTSAAAAHQLGFRAIGRPSNNGGRDLVRFLLIREKVKQDVVIVADNDPEHYLPDGTPFFPGTEGALALAEALRGGVTGRLRILKPREVKDLRQWLNAGGSAEELIHVLSQTAKGREIVGRTPAWLCFTVTSDWLSRQYVRLAEAKKNKKERAA